MLSFVFDEMVLCGRNGCDEMFARATVGRPRKFCSTACRQAHSRAEIRAIQAHPTYRTVHDSLTRGDDLTVIRTADYARLVTATARAIETLTKLKANLDPQSVGHRHGYFEACDHMRSCMTAVKEALNGLHVGTYVGDASQ